MIKRRLIFTLLAALLISWPHPTAAQGESDLFARINSLRTSLGLAPYSRSTTLDVAARNQAQWMAQTGSISHTQDNGSTPRTRASAAGYPSTWVSENIYGGTNASPDAAWNFWLNSPIHYRGMTSPNYVEIGIGTAGSDWGRAYVLVFGNATSSWSPSTGGATSSGGGSGASGGGESAVAAPPSFVVGLDAYGNIMHEIQPGDTLGDIALLYGYTWDDLPTMLTLNALSEDDARVLEVGAVFLVPPSGGTYTPTPAPPTDTATPTPEGELIEAAVFTESAPTATLPPTATPPRIVTAGAVVADVPTVAALTPSPTVTAKPSPMPEPVRRITPSESRPVGLYAAVAAQVLLVLGAGVMWLRGR